MCTLSWRLTADGYEVFFSRDELRTRPVAEPPALREEQQRSFLAPRDPQGAGTWIAVNELGITYCLLNGYQVGDRAEALTHARSRGHLVWTVATLYPTLDSSGVESWLQRELGRELYRSFQLLAFQPGAPPRAWSYLRSSLKTEDLQSPVVSSSVDPEGARTTREALYAALSRPISSSSLHHFHRSHDGEPSARTPCMHREDARTVSLTRVLVDAATASMSYTPGPPCRTPFGQPLMLSRL